MKVKDSTMNIRKVIKNGIIRLLMNDPFFGCLLLQLKLLIGPRFVKTMGTDGVYLLVNPDWTNKWTFNEVTGVLVHEAWHVGMKHMLRRGNRDFKRWNRACDFAIDQYIVGLNGKNKKYDLPDGGHIDPRFTGMSAEKIYDILEQDDKNNGTSGQTTVSITMIDPNAPPSDPIGGEGPNDDVIFDVPFITEEEERAFEEQLDLAIQAAYQSSKDHGPLPGNLGLDIKSRHEHVVDYRELLRDWLNKNVNNQDYDWLYCDRRFVGTGFHIPGIHDTPDQLPAVLLVSDVSGSMLGRGLEQTAAEINGVLKEFPTDYYCIFTDTMVEGIQRLDPEDDFRLTCKHGGGGTNFRKVLEYINTNAREIEVEFDAILFFTDLYVDDFGDDPGKPVLWMNTAPRGEVKVPYGRVIDIKK
jgi:predicted metal-dependent peptidase